MRELPTASVDCVITSPPYFQLRDYGVPGQLGLEPTVGRWVENLRRVIAEMARVLRPSGSLWLNLGDSYSRHRRYGAEPKSLLLAPERLLLGLVADGWVVRNKVVWAKSNPMPHSVADRLSTAHEVVYFLVRSRRYYFDLDRIREPHRSRAARRAQPAPRRPTGWAGPLAGSQDGLQRARAAGVPGHWLGKNPGDIWALASSRFRGAHFATFPEALVERPLVATCPERLCQSCGTPWRRPATVTVLGQRQAAPHDPGNVRRYPRRWETLRQVGELQPACRCAADWQPGVVLDPFFGSGTVGVVAKRHGRDWVGIELNPAYALLAEERLGQTSESGYRRAAPWALAA